MKRIESFDFKPGTKINEKFHVIQKIGQGYEGEVYLVREKETKIERAAKVFFPHRNKNNSALKFQATKSHKLKNCPIVTQYFTQEEINFSDTKVFMLISEFVEGLLLKDFLEKLPEKRLSPYEALHFLYSLCKGVKEIHDRGEYHGDLHYKNIIVAKRGITFELKIIDMYHFGRASRENIQMDVFDMINLFYDIMGGQATYRTHPKFIKEICCGKNRVLIQDKFKNAGELKQYIEQITWN
jgi:serine/threonine protein kinase